MNPPSSSRGSIFSPPPSSSRTAASSVYSGTPARQIQHATFKSTYLDINADGKDSAVMNLYARISVPTNASGSQQALILFPEGNLTLRSYDIHPLNSRGRPYAYPPDSSPLIRRAGRVLRLGDPLDEYYSEALEKTIIRSPTRPGTTPRRNNLTTLTPNSLGSITVQNLNFAFLTPRYIPRPADGTDRSSDGTASESRSARRMSFSASTPDGRAASKYHCIIVMELLVPIVSMPDISPYMLYLRIPKCLDNRVRVALPSDREWNVFTHPSIDQQAGSVSTSTWDAEGFADDEGQDRAEDVIKGTFQSSETLVVRWSAKIDDDAPEADLEQTAVQSPRHRRSRSRSSSRSSKSGKQVIVNLKRAKLCRVEGDAKYMVHPMETEQYVEEDGDRTIRLVRYVPLDIEYSARCVGFHHSGTETQLGVDLVLASAGGEPMEVDWAEVDAHGHLRTDTAGTVEDEAMWKIDPYSEAFKAWNTISTNPQLGTRSRDHSPSPGGANSRSLASLRRTDTLVTEGSTSGSSGPSFGHRRSGGSNNLSGGYGAPSARQPLPRGDIPDASAEDFSLGEPSGLDGSLTRRSVSRTSSDPFSSSTSSMGKAVSRQSSGDPDALQSQGSFSFSEAGSEVTSLSGVASYMASPHRPRSRYSSYPTYLPSDPIVLHVDLLDMLATQRDPNPSMATVTFTIKGQILVRLPDETPDNGKTIPIHLPLFRFPGADDQKCNVLIESAAGSRGRGAFEVIVNQKRISPGPNGYQAKEVVVAPSAPIESDITVAFSLRALGKSSIGQSNSLMNLLKNSLGYSSTPGSPGSPTQLRSPRRNTRLSEASNSSVRGLQASGEVDHDPASELKMPSPFGPPDDSQPGRSQGRFSLTPTRNSNHRSTASLPPTDQALSLAWVDINVVVSPPTHNSSPTELSTAEQGSWSYVVHVRSSWPSIVGGGALLDCVEFGLPKFNSASTEATPHVAIRSVHVGSIPALFDFYDNESEAGAISSQILSAFAEKSGNESRSLGAESKWFAWTKVNLPDGTIPSEGNMEIIYTVATGSRSSRKALIDLLLPCFTIGVARMTVNVDGPEVDSFRDYTLTPYTRRQLSITLSKEYFTARLMPAISTTLRAFHFLLTVSALYYIWVTRQYPEGAPGLLTPGSFSEAAFSPLAKLVNVTLSGSGKKPASSGVPPSSTTVSIYSASSTPSITRRPPKETYVPPDDLWGAWDTTQQDPFPAVSEDPLETTPDDPVGMPAGPVTSDSADPALPLNLGVLGTFTHLVLKSDKYQHSLLRIKLWDRGHS
ncbi:hypothetical protein FRC01_005232 [Tulasnella sp. 417]|nr:hypothetical protein FRC01_005232 [Tulasnella sp. 417]